MYSNNVSLSENKRKFYQLALLNNRYPALHGLRVIAVFIIVQVHMTSTAVFRDYPVGESLKWYSQALWPGMDFFFVLSGFLIGTMLLHSLRENSHIRLGRFYIRRAFRIFPLYYLTLLIISQLPQAPNLRPHSGIVPHHDGIQWREWVYLTNYPMDTSNVMYWSWSLSVEEHFYLLVPFLLLGLRKLKSPKAQLKALGLLWTGCLLIKLVTVYWFWPKKLPIYFFTAIYFPTHTRYDALIAGIFAAYLHQLWPAKLGHFFRSAKGRLLAGTTTFGVLGLALTQFSVGELSLRESSYYLKGAFLVGTPTSVAFGILILWAVHDQPKLLSRPIFLRIATLSYGIYLIHIPILELLVFPRVVQPILDSGYGFGTAWSLGFLAAIPAVIGTSYLLHLMLEKPMLHVREKLAP